METLHRDYAPKGVNFYYVYKALAHPGMNGYLRPFSLKERLLHVHEARAKLGSKFTWLCDTMDGDLTRALGSAANSEYVISPEGKIVRMRAWSNPPQLRRDLEELVGPVDRPTRVADLDSTTSAAPPKESPTGVVPPIEVPEGMVPLKVEPQIGPESIGLGPFYVKLQAEVQPQVLQTGKGKMYLRFQLDPIHHVHWNNLVEALQYELTPPGDTTLSPLSASGPKVEQPSDIDPREFLLDIDKANFFEPIELTVKYFACSDEQGWCKPVTQRYAIHLQQDPRAGRTGGRGFGPGGGRPGGGRPGGMFPGGGSAERLVDRIMSDDQDGDGMVSREEASGRLRDRFDFMDANRDGFVDEKEAKRMSQRFRGRPRP